MSDESRTVSEVASGRDGGLAAELAAHDAWWAGRVEVLRSVRHPPAAYIEKARFQPMPHGTATHARADIEWAWHAIISQYLGETVDG